MNILKKSILPIINSLGHKIERRHFSEPPVIIGACPRSGTTILLSVLSAHPAIFTIPRQTYAFEQWFSQGTPKRLDRLYRPLLWRRIPPEARRWMEKTPYNIRHIDKILNYYQGNVRFIHIIRDGRDVVTSYHPVHSPDHYWVSINRWVEDVTLGLQYASHSSVLTLRYEDFVNNFEQTMDAVSKFLQLEFSAMLSDWQQKSKIKKSKHWSKGQLQRLNGHSIGRWRQAKHEQRIAEFIAHEPARALMVKLGYLES